MNGYIERDFLRENQFFAGAKRVIEEELAIEKIYSNGLPHPSTRLRWRFAVELIVLIALTTLFLSLAPDSLRNTGAYIGLAIIMLGYIKFTAKENQERIWGPPVSPEFDRIRHCAINMTLLTLPTMIVFLIFGVIARYWQLWWFKNAVPMFSLNFFITLCLYLPWALLQQTLFQFYLLGRLRALLPFAPVFLLSFFNGIMYGLVHLPDPWVTVMTMIGGVFWSYSYHCDRYVLPLAISHATLGSTFYYWVYGRDLLNELSMRG